VKGPRGRHAAGQSRRAPLPVPADGVVKVRPSGEMADISRAAELLTQAGAEVLDASGPRANREDPGVRVYLTVRVDTTGRQQ